MTLLLVQDLAKSFGGVTAARGVGFHVERGEMVALIGPNGAGKSTVFNMIGGQLNADHGRTLLDGADITSTSPQERFRLGVGRTFQVAQAFLSMTVIE
ncbi:ATP-binding cassette domain-containing protein, partial [Corallococcus exiguus]|uniref:ATP-binding cassette domain-containing protein n=1 Tax=Corallococcus exiguus TaxID=83462 RepID=UPI001475CD1D